MKLSNHALRSASALLLCSALATGNAFAGGHAKVKATIQGSEGQDHGIVEFYGVPGGVLMDAQLKDSHQASMHSIFTQTDHALLTSKRPVVISIPRVLNMGLALESTRVRIRTSMCQRMGRYG